MVNRRNSLTIAAAFMIVLGGTTITFADTINGTGDPGALVQDADSSQLNLPIPHYQYYAFQTFEWDDEGGPDMSNFGAGFPTGFMVSGNTMYNFTGNQELAMYVMNSPPVAETLDESDAVPEPAGIWMTVLGFGWTGWLKRRARGRDR